MSIGSLLVQPQRLERSSRDAKAAIAQDVLRLAALLAEDAGDDGPLAAVVPQAVSRLGDRVQTRAEGGVNDVFGSLKARLRPLFLYFEDLLSEAETIGEDPARVIALMRSVLDGLQGLLGSFDQGEIRAWLEYLEELVESDLGFDRHFVDGQIAGFLDELETLWEALPSELSAGRRRRRRMAIQCVRRLRRHLLGRFRLPEIDTARAARSLYRLLTSSGVRDVLAEIRCVLDKVEASLDAAVDLADALPAGAGGDAVGAAPVSIPGATRYCWYASWLLGDDDIPLLGTGDVEDKRIFAINIRFRTNVRAETRAVSKYLFSTLTVEQQRRVMDYPGGSAEPDDELVLMLLGHINTLMQTGPIYTHERFATPHPDQSPENLNAVPYTFRLRTEDAFSLPDELAEMAGEYAETQCLYHYNRRFLEWVYGGDVLSEMCNGFWRFVGRKALGLVDWKRHVVFVSGDGRYVMCDDMPIHVAADGAQAKWEEAPMFVDKDSRRTPARGAFYYRFTRVSAFACDVLAQVLETLAQAGRPVWHLADLQPGHKIGTGIVAGLDFAHVLHELLFFKPITGHASVPWLTKWFDSGFFGLRALALVGGSFEGKHSEATGGNIFWFWLTVFLGDVFRVSGHNGIIHTVRDAILGFVTLLNSSASNSGDSSLPSNPAANHLKQGGITSPMNTLFAYLLVLLYRRENHSIEIWSADDIGDRREHAFGLWFGGGIGFGILAGLSGSIVSQFIAWQEDWKLLGITIGESVATLFLGYWFFEYLFKEGDTADGTYALTGEYRGYPPRESSPYRLPFAEGTALYMGQGNTGLFSHNEISNIDSNWQVYAYDLGHDHQQLVLAMRSGVVWDFDESRDDNNEDDANFIVIRHDTLVDRHDDPRGTGTPQVTFARYLHGAQGGVTRAFGGVTPTRERTSPGMGTAVTQGQAIMEADDTGTSFHSHLHIYVVTGTSTAPGDESIPLVFADVDGDGVMKALTWYEAGD